MTYGSSSKYMIAYIYTSDEREHMKIMECFRYFEVEGFECQGMDTKDKKLFQNAEKVFVHHIDLKATR